MQNRGLVAPLDELNEQMRLLHEFVSPYGILLNKPKEDEYQPEWPGSYHFFEDTLLHIAGITTRPQDSEITVDERGSVKFSILGLTTKDDALFARYLNMPLQEVGGDVDGASVFIISLEQLRNQLIPQFKRQLAQYGMEAAELKPYLCFDWLIKRLMEEVVGLHEYIEKQEAATAFKPIIDHLEETIAALSEKMIHAMHKTKHLDRKKTDDLLLALKELGEEIVQGSQALKDDNTAASQLMCVLSWVKKMIMFITPLKPAKPYAIAARPFENPNRLFNARDNAPTTEIMRSLRDVPASISPIVAFNRDDSLVTIKEDNDLIWCLIKQPNAATECAVKILLEEFGAHSENYYQSLPDHPRHGTGSGKTPISSCIVSYIEHYVDGCYATGLFYPREIKAIVEPVMANVFTETRDMQHSKGMKKS